MIFDLARLLVDMIETDKYGYYHATNSELPATESGYDENGTKTGYISWYDFTKEIYRQAGYDTKVTPVTTAEYGLSKAVRPFNSRLDKSKLVKAIAGVDRCGSPLFRDLEEARFLW